MTHEETQNKAMPETATPNRAYLSWKETLDLLYKTFPHCFIEGRDKKPLQIGIYEPLKERLKNYPVSEKLLKNVLGFYIRKPSYSFAFKEGAMRVDLDGNPVEPVTKEHIAHAQMKIKAMFAKAKKLREQKAAKEAKEKEKSLEVIKKNESEIKSLLEEENKKLLKSEKTEKQEKKPTLSLKKKKEIKEEIS